MTDCLETPENLQKQAAEVSGRCLVNKQNHWYFQPSSSFDCVSAQRGLELSVTLSIYRKPARNLRDWFLVVSWGFRRLPDNPLLTDHTVYFLAL